MQNTKDLYQELCTLLSEKIPQIKWFDLWHNQVNFLAEEHPFPTPAIFFAFRINDTNDVGEKVQHVGLQIMIYVYYETFADTYKDSWNKESALAFLDILNQLQAALHGTSGENYSEMRRLPGMAPVDAGEAGNLYQLPFYCTLVDYSAMKQWTEGEVTDLTIESGQKPVEEQEEEENYFNP